MKKILCLIAVSVLVIAQGGCVTESNKTNTTFQNKIVTTAQATSTEPLNDKQEPLSSYLLSQELSFLGYKMYCPSDSIINCSSCGWYFDYSNEFTVIIETPSFTGANIDVTDLNDIADKCIESVCDSVNEKSDSIFLEGKTAQEIVATQTITINNIEMAKATGRFVNSASKRQVPFAAYYLIFGDIPIYIVCYAENGSCESVEMFMDEFASHITK